MPNYGVITEQGDLGLGFDYLNKKDNKTYHEAVTGNKDYQDSKNSYSDEKNKR